ncbi:uncharacterized protein [Nicotiana sylvestris]|uniref:uncharacterized protein n=1 Tax=Nicotiana sylvestris TaxID=4096 RepID=UPI00388C61DD
MRPPPPGEKENPKPSKEKERKRRLPVNSPKPKKSKARKPKADTMALSPEAAQHLRDQEEEGEDDDCLLVARERGGSNASKAAKPMVAEAAVSLHRQAFSKSRTELARCEAKLKKLAEERDNLKILYVKKEGEISDLRVELTKVGQEQTKLIEKQKGELVEQLQEEIKMKEAKILGWRQGMDCLTSEKDTLREQLASIERQLQSVKEESLARRCKIKELKAKSAAKLAKAKSKAEEISTAAEVKLSCALDNARGKFRRETFEEVHARGFDLSADIEKAKSLEEEAIALLFEDDDSASSYKSGGDEDGVPEEEVLGDEVPKDAAAEDLAP